MKQVLTTDLDGTLIPLKGNQENLYDLNTLKKLIRHSGIELLFVTGRHFEIVTEAIEQYQLPQPDWILCDVGTTILHQTAQGSFQRLEDYRKELAAITSHFPLQQLQQELSKISELRLQEEEKQGEFKLSFYCEPSAVAQVVEAIENKLTDKAAPYSLISSIDPDTGEGLIDLLPDHVSKAFALDWWTEYSGIDRKQLTFAGDSGNDTAALTAGYQSIVVGNAPQDVVDEVVRLHAERGFHDRLFLADLPATSGVLQGCQHFKVFEK